MREPLTPTDVSLKMNCLKYALWRPCAATFQLVRSPLCDGSSFWSAPTGFHFCHPPLSVAV